MQKASTQQRAGMAHVVRTPLSHRQPTDSAGQRRWRKIDTDLPALQRAIAVPGFSRCSGPWPHQRAAVLLCVGAVQQAQPSKSAASTMRCAISVIFSPLSIAALRSRA